MHHQLKHPIGLSADPVAKTVTVAPFTGEVISLPYMGIHKDDDTYKTPYMTEEVKLKRHVIKEIGEDGQRPPEFQDPLDVLINKIERLSNMLGCTQQEAEALLFDRL